MTNHTLQLQSGLPAEPIGYHRAVKVFPEHFLQLQAGFPAEPIGYQGAVEVSPAHSSHTWDELLEILSSHVLLPPVRHEDQVEEVEAKVETHLEAKVEVQEVLRSSSSMVELAPILHDALALA